MTSRTHPPLGRMLVDKGLVTEDELAGALAEHELTSRPLGEVLVSQGLVSAAGLADALLLQHTWRPLGQLLVERGLVTADQLDAALAEQATTGRPLGEIVRMRFFVSAAELGDLIAEQHELELEMDRGFGTGLRRGIEARHQRRRRAEESEPQPDDALLLTRLRATGDTSEEGDRIRTLQAALETREETIASLAAANRKRTQELEGLRRELGERDLVIAQLESRIADLEGRDRPSADVLPLNPR